MAIRNSLLELCTNQGFLGEDQKERYCMEFAFKADWPIFQGHFPNHPVLPAVVQMLMAEIALENMLKEKCLTKKVVQAKFLEPVVPPCHVRSLVSHTDTRAEADLFVMDKKCARIEWEYYAQTQNT